MSANNRLSFAGINDMTLWRGGTTTNVTTFIRFTADNDGASNLLTDVTYNSGQQLDHILVGQQLLITGVGLTDNKTTITNVNLGSNQITVADTITTVLSDKLIAVIIPKGQAFVESGSLTAPQNTGLTFQDITGSNDSNYEAGDSKWNVFLQLASTASDSSTQGGVYGQYQVYKFFNRTSATRASFYVTASSAEGVLVEPPGLTPSSGIVGFPVFEVSVSESLGPIFASADVEGSNVSAGAGFAAYQIAADNFLDATTTGSSGGGSGTVTEVDATGTVNGITLTTSPGGGITTTGTVTLGGTLGSITNSQLTNNSIFIGNQSIALGASGSNFSGLVASGSFSGSYIGNGSGLTGISATSVANSLTDGAGIIDFTYNGASAATVSVDSGSLVGNGLTTSTGKILVQASGSTIEVGSGGIRVNDSSITPIQISSSIAGNGLSGGNGAPLAVNVDDSSIEINSDTLRIKSDGVTNAMLQKSSLMIGSTGITLGNTGSALAGLTSVTSTDYLGGTLAGTKLSGSFTGSFKGDGSGLTGIGQTLNINADSGTPGSVALLTQTASFSGTSNEVETSVAGQTVTIGLPSDVTITQDLVVGRNLSVAGTASFTHREDFDVADRFVRLASGSESAGDGGIVVQQTSPTDGEAFVFDADVTRWGFTSSFNPSTSVVTPDAFVSTVIEGSGNNPSEVVTRYQKKGNIFVAANGDIHIYS